MGEPESLDTDEPLARHVARHDYDRLLMLSDGVFAIAMTLLVLEVRPEAGARTLWSGLAPSLGAFSLTFAVTAVFWLTHKRLFARVRRVDGRLTALSLLLLGLIALLPAATALISRSRLGGQEVLFYLLLVGMIGVIQGLAWVHAGFAAKLVHPEVSGRTRALAALFSAIMPITFSSLSLYAARTGSPPVVAAAVAVAVALILLRNWAAREDARRPPSAAPAVRS